jgi:hypothetical protein
MLAFKVWGEALSRWRVLTAFLCSNPTEDHLYISQRDTTIQNAVNDFSRAFSSWKNPKYADEERESNLTEIMKSAAELGIRLFGQPATFQFHWGERQHSDAKIIIAPALFKVRDERTRVLHQPQRMTGRVVQSI